jgi:hypothetical protein
MMVTTPSLSISPEKVCFFVVKAREFDVKDVVTDPDSGSNPTDDAMLAVLEDHPAKGGNPSFPNSQPGLTP